MPNCFGGDQFHPAYDPRTVIGDNEYLLSGRLYVCQKDGTVRWEDADGDGGEMPINHVPLPAMEKFERWLKKSKK